MKPLPWPTWPSILVYPDGTIINEITMTKYEPYTAGLGYQMIDLRCFGLGQRTVHRIVSETFLDNPDELPQVNHKDGDRANNHVNNLEWVTQSENLKHARLKSTPVEIIAISLKNSEIYPNITKCRERHGLTTDQMRYAIKNQKEIDGKIFIKKETAKAANK